MNIKKRVLAIFSVVGIFALFSLPMFVGASSPLDGCNISDDNLKKLQTMGIYCDSYCAYSNADNQCGACCILNGVYNITDWIFVGLMAISAVMIMYGAFLFVTAGAGKEPEKASQGKSLLLYACVGIAIAFFSRALPSLVKLMIGV